jgi:hypothetical protein
VKSGAGVLNTQFPKYDISTELGFPEYMKVSGLRATPGITLSNYASGGINGSATIDHETARKRRFVAVEK